jgi:alginate biosynthesis protein Alg44
MVVQSVPAAAKIERDSEPQRHHVRVQLPVIVVLDGKKYTTDDISAGGFSIKAGRDIFQKGIQAIKVYFPFQNFAFHLQLQARPLYHDQKSNKIGFVFPDIDARQLSLLNLVIKSSLSGEIAPGGEMLEVLKHQNAPKPDPYPHNKWGRILPLGIIVLAGVTGLALLGGSIYENTSIVKSYLAVVEADTHMVRAEGDGVYNSLLAENAKQVTRGQDIAVLKSENAPATATDDMTNNMGPVVPGDGNLLIKSPCDCLIMKNFASEGEFHMTGEPLFELLPLNAKRWVTASIRPDQSNRLKLLDDAYVQMAGENKFLEGHVMEFLPPDFINGSSRIRIETTDPIPPELIGQPAYVEFVIF